MNIYDLGFDSSKKTPAIIKARVIEMHKKHGSMLKEDAMLEYVKIVENIFPYRLVSELSQNTVLSELRTYRG